jgi:hypothetical protein
MRQARFASLPKISEPATGGRGRSRPWEDLVLPRESGRPIARITSRGSLTALPEAVDYAGPPRTIFFTGG